MTHFAKILVPLDLSARSIATARYALWLVAELGSELVFVHAIEEGWPLDAAHKAVRDQISKLHGDTQYRFAMREGDPVDVILATAKGENVDLSRRGR